MICRNAILFLWTIVEVPANHITVVHTQTMNRHKKRSLKTAVVNITFTQKILPYLTPIGKPIIDWMGRHSPVLTAFFWTV